MGVSSLIMMQGEPVLREQHSIDDDVHALIVGHALFPIALLTQDEFWYHKIAGELRVSVDVIKEAISDVGGRVCQ